jgi:hypothetical protein
VLKLQPSGLPHASPSESQAYPQSPPKHPAITRVTLREDHPTRGRAPRRVREASGGPGGGLARRRREAPWSWASTDDGAARRRPAVASRTSPGARPPGHPAPVRPVSDRFGTTGPAALPVPARLPAQEDRAVQLAVPVILRRSGECLTSTPGAPLPFSGWKDHLRTLPEQPSRRQPARPGPAAPVPCSPTAPSPESLTGNPRPGAVRVPRSRGTGVHQQALAGLPPRHAGAGRGCRNPAIAQLPEATRTSLGATPESGVRRQALR